MRGLIRAVFSAVLLCCVAVGAVGQELPGGTAGPGVFAYSVASGDPTPTSVVLWTRAEAYDSPATVSLKVSTDLGGQDVVAGRQITVTEEDDWIAKVRVDGLEPDTFYYYRFAYMPPGIGGEIHISRTGRTRTAPLPTTDRPVRFAVVYCQDYVGRYYNTYQKMLLDHDEDIDFVVHLGDYIYETTGDPTFQDPNSARQIEFDDLEGAILLGNPADNDYAAASLDNYRQLFRTYHSDPILQQVHERWPMLVIWDDHEYSNDSWGATSTYSNGRIDEYDVERRQNSERAFFEWIPIDVGLDADGQLDIDAADLYPNSLIYRDLIYGSNLHLVLTDLRTFRPDHLIAEDAFPGTIAVDEGTLGFLIGESWPNLRSSFDPYVDMGLLGSFLPILQQTATMIAANLYTLENPSLDLFTAVRTAEEAMAGNVSATFVNLLFEGAGLTAPFTPEILAALPRGVSYLLMGKTAIYSSSGSRTQVVKDTFDLYAASKYFLTGGEAQEVYGGQQNAWLQGTLLSSPATWKVLGHSFMMTPMVIDFTNPLIASFLPPEFPDFLRTRLIINNEDFNGLPQKTQEVLGLLDIVDNVVVISGDIHSTFVTNHQNGIYEVTPPAISSATNGEIVARTIASDPILGQIPGIEGIIAQYALLLQVSSLSPAVSPSDILYANTFSHGYGIFDVTPDAVTFVIQEISSDEAGTDYSDDPEALDELFTPIMFTIEDGAIRPGP